MLISYLKMAFVLLNYTANCVFNAEKGGNKCILVKDIFSIRYPDVRVRAFAVDCLRKMPTDDLIDFIPQLIQVIS